VTWATSVPILVFLYRPLCSRFRPDVRDRQTDKQIDWLFLQYSDISTNFRSEFAGQGSTLNDDDDDDDDDGYRTGRTNGQTAAPQFHNLFRVRMIPIMEWCCPDHCPYDKKQRERGNRGRGKCVLGFRHGLYGKASSVI